MIHLVLIIAKFTFMCSCGITNNKQASYNCSANYFFFYLVCVCAVLSVAPLL